MSGTRLEDTERFGRKSKCVCGEGGCWSSVSLFTGGNREGTGDREKREGQGRCLMDETGTDSLTVSVQDRKADISGHSH